MPESLFPPFRLEIRVTPIDDFFRFMLPPMSLGGTPEEQHAAGDLRWEFADQARETYERGDSEGADALMRLAEEITPATIRFMSERERHVTPLYRDERVPGFVAAHITDGKGEVHNPRSQFEPSALSQVTLPPSLRAKFGLGE